MTLKIKIGKKSFVKLGMYGLAALTLLIASYFLIFYVFPAFALFDQTLTSTSVSVSKSFLGQDTNFNNVWFKNGTAAWVNFTISLNASANITAINITIPGSGNTANFTVENATAGFTPVINASETWVIDYPENYSTDTRAKVVRFNVTDWGRGLKYPNSTKISLYVTPILTSNADLDKNTWSVAIWNASVDGGGATVSNSTSLNTWIDSRRPVLINTTPLNATSIKGTATQSFQVYASDYNLNTSNTSLYWRLCANYPTGCGDSYRVALTCLDWGADNDNRTYICSNTVDLSMAQPGRTIAYYFEASDNTTNLGVNGTTSDSLQTIIDQASPLWSANDTSPDSGAEYSSGKDYSFEIAWTDALSSVGGVIFEHNFTTGTLVNKTVSKSGNAYYVNFTGSEFKKAGNYTFRWYANDSVLPEADANWNTSDSWAFNLAKNTTNPLAIYMNGTADSNLTVRYPALVNATVNASYASSGTPSIFRNGTDVTAEVETNVKLPFGDYLYLFNISGNVNYSSNATGATYYAFVERGDTTINLYLNDTLNTDLTIAKGKTVNITLSSTNAEGTLFLYVNGTLHNQTTGVSTVENLTALTGVPGTTWNVTGYSSQSQNYSAAAQIEHYIIVESTPPHYIDNNTFNKSIGSYFGKYEGPLIINAQWKDGFELQNYWLSVQNGTSCGTGNWCNDTASTFDTAANLTNVTINPSTINIANGNVILNASIYANDTSGNVNHTDIYYWIIDGAAPVMRNITPINSAYINGSSNQLFQVYVSDYTLNMSNASLYWKSCAPYPTVCGGWSSRVALTCYKYDSTGNAAPNFICNSTVNLGGQNIGDTIAYYFEASDNSTIYGNNATSSSPNLAYIDDRVAPSYKNNATNTTVIGKFDAVYISANWTDATLDSWTVETDEGGVGQNFKNKTPSAFNSGTWSNYTWSNSTVAVGTTVRLRIYANDTTGKENVTTNMTFQIENTVPWAAVTDTNTTNASTIAKGAILNISANWTDNLGFISGPYTGYWWVQTNSSTDGSTYALANTSAAPFTANNQTNVSYNINTVTYARGSTVTARIFANDTSGNLNYTDLWLWTIDGTVPWAAVTDTNTTNGSTIVKGTVINITANWTDNLGFIGGAMPGFWWIWTNVSTTTDVYAASNSTAVAFTANNQTNVSYNINTVTYARGSIVTAIIYANDTSGNENSTDPWYWTIDGTAPIPINESVEPASETSYAPGKSYVFNVSVSDNINVSVVTLDWNGTANYTATLVNSSGVTARAFNYSVTITDLPRSNNTYRWVANDTSGNWNSTATYNYNVTANATNPVDIYINDTLNLNDTSVTYNTTINATVAAAYSLSGSTYIYRSESDVSSTENATNITLAVGTWYYKVNMTGNANYSSNATGATFTVTVTKATPLLRLWLTNGTIAEGGIIVEGNSTVIVGRNINFTSTINTLYSVPLNLSVNIAGWDSKMSTTAAVGIRIENTTQTTNVAEGEYNVTAYTLGDANYTENSTTYWLTVTGDSTAPAIRVYVYQNGTIKRPETTFAINISVTDTGVGAAGTCNITINSTSVENITLSSNWCNGTVTVPTRAKVPVDGNYTINITIKDTNGNLGVNASYVVTVDNTPPILSITSPVNGTYNKSDTQSFVWFNGTVSDNINMSTGNVSINGTFEVYGFTGVNASEFNVRNSSAIANGEVLLIFNYTDYAGNVGNASAYFYLDNTAPATVKGVVNSTIGDYQPNSTQVINVQVADNMQTNDSIIFNYYTSVNLTTLTSVITGAVGTTTVYTTTIDTSKLTTNSKVWYWVTGVDNATNSISSSVGGSVGTPLQNIKIDENCGNEGLGWTNGLCKSETDMTGWAYLPVGRASMVNAMGSLGGNRTTPKVLASISGNYSYVYYYNGSSWFSYDPSLSWSQSDLKYMNQSAGSGNYFINMTSRDVIRIMPA